jgi:hypothetical protein
MDMKKFFQATKILSTRFIFFCFLRGLVFSAYYDSANIDFFTSSLTDENQNLSTLSNLEKDKSNLIQSENIRSRLLYG